MDLSSNQKSAQTKVCTKCGKELPIEQFNRRSRSVDGFQLWCKSCHNEALRNVRSSRQSPPHQGRPVIPACGIYTASAYRRIA